ncbi:MAG: class I SAM-dependent methyltransferase [Desulfuromonadales bacterium]|nr:class I SAM-dependent methyltransferase [Desulfuromonadales bacterium]MDW7758158.1 class I SAM-dependent methyltransferase [Desulfuromonadales bacterium]
MNHSMESERYLASCQSPFWRKVFAAELDYLLRHLRAEDRVLSVGCGPAIIESGLSEQGIAVTGLDVSREALACAPDSLCTIVAPAEKMPIEDGRFDVILFIVSLQFMEDYRRALSEAARVLRPGGRIIVMLLNPASSFFQGKLAEADSYVRKIRHTDLNALEAAMAARFSVQGEYFLGIDGQEIFPSHEPGQAALYVLRGTKL